jgi:hypothetical protein
MPPICRQASLAFGPAGNDVFDTSMVKGRLTKPDLQSFLAKPAPMLSSLFAIALLHWAVLVIPGFNFVLSVVC